MSDGLGLDAWWEEPAYKPCNTLHRRGTFIFRKLREHDAAKLQAVMDDLYPDQQPDPEDIGTFARPPVLSSPGASPARTSHPPTTVWPRRRMTACPRAAPAP